MDVFDANGFIPLRMMAMKTISMLSLNGVTIRVAGCLAYTNKSESARIVVRWGRSSPDAVGSVLYVCINFLCHKASGVLLGTWRYCCVHSQQQLVIMEGPLIGAELREFGSYSISTNMGSVDPPPPPLSTQGHLSLPRDVNNNNGPPLHRRQTAKYAGNTT